METRTVRTADHGLAGWLEARLNEARERVARYRRYRTTLSELEAMTDRDLTDLGLRRSMLREIAREAARQG